MLYPDVLALGCELVLTLIARKAGSYSALFLRIAIQPRANTRVTGSYISLLALYRLQDRHDLVDPKFLFAFDQ